MVKTDEIEGTGKEFNKRNAGKELIIVFVPRGGQNIPEGLSLTQESKQCQSRMNRRSKSQLTHRSK
jgi:hypothetical protein